MMFVTNERKPKSTNWFSSLRRQPKNKKPDFNLQKSCLDLSTTTTTTSSSPTFLPTIKLTKKGVSTPVIPTTIQSLTTITTKQQQQPLIPLSIYQHNGNNKNVSQSSLTSTASAYSIPISIDSNVSSTSTRSSTSSIEQQQQQHQQNHQDNVCQQCFMKLKNEDLENRKLQRQQQQQHQQQNHQHHLQLQPPKEENHHQQLVEQKNSNQLENDLIKMDDLITNSNQTVYFYNQKKEFSTVTKKTTTTTTITRTTILNKQIQNQNRDGLVFSDNTGDLLNDIYNKKKFLLNQKINLTNNNNNNLQNINNNINNILLNTNTNTNNLINNKNVQINNRDGLIFDDNGKLLMMDGNKSNNSNNNLLVLNNNNTNINNNNNNNNSSDNNNYGSCNTVSSLEYTPTTIEDDFEFIDSSTFNEIYDRQFGHLNKTKIKKLCKNCIKKNSHTNNSNNNNSNTRSQSEWNLSTRKQIKDELCEVVSEMEALDSPEDCKHSNKDKQMSIGRKKFNMDPKKGIEYLVENHLLQMDAQGVAHFLYKGEGLNKTAIGDYLGEKNDFNEQVLKAFVELHDFTDLILVQALRQFLWSFRLPGEAQKIDRMMECFAQRYCQLNPDIFTNTDTCYVLSFAIIMLNTSLHNPSVKDKPSVEQFISMNRGINNGGDLPRELLESLYDSIRTEPFKIPQDDGNDLMHTFFNPDKEGWLWKQGGRYKSWKRRWFILNDNCLYYFEYTTDKEPRGIIPLENISVREITDRNKPHCFELYACGDIIKACKTDSEGKVVEGKHTVYRMSAATEEDKLDWIKCLTQSISYNPFYDILVQRKKKALAKS